ncbi:MAG: hypothetical protein KBT48_11080, partial [Firmicutes bacterium]|nr:hypothetical protein [Bacillota bacterium]
MKRLVALLLPVTLAVGCFTAVGPTNTYAKETKAETISYEVNVSEEEEELTDEQLAEVCERNGYLSIDMNLDGTATITVTPKRAKEILKGKLEYMKNRVQEII